MASKFQRFVRSACRPTRTTSDARSAAVGSAALWWTLAAPLSLGTQTSFAQDNAPIANSIEDSIAEVVVTARKRSESLRDVPVAVSALSAAQLEQANIGSGADLFGQVPNLYFTDTGRTSETRFTMRGVGARSPLETSVAVFVDGVYMPTVGWDMNFLDIERLEVLRGPQGALFGRNTQAGAINIVTRPPQSQFGGRLRVEFDEFDTARGDVYLTGPITDSLLIAASAQAERTDGYVKNVTLGNDLLERDQYSARLALRLEPSDRVDATLFLDGVYREGGFYGFGEPLAGQANSIGDYIVVNDQENYEELENYGGSVNINFETEFAALTSITGVRRISSLTLADRDVIDTPNRDGLAPKPIPESILDGRDVPSPSGNYFVFARDQSLISQELRLASKSEGALKWLIGLYGFIETNDSDRWLGMEDSFRFTHPTNFLIDSVDQDRDGYAIFGQGSYRFTDRLEFTLGGRLTQEHVEQDLAIQYFIGNGAIRNNFTSNPEEDYSDFTPSGSLAFRWNDDLMTYVSVAEGFKGGGFTLTAPQGIEGNIEFDSEQSRVYELGAKSSFFDRRLTLDAALYWIDTTDMQVTTTVVIGGSVVTQATTNAAKARSRGAELEMQAIPVRGLRLAAAVGYIDAEYVDYLVDPTLDLSGRPIEEIPEWTGNFTVDYTLPLSQAFDVTLGGSYRYVGEILQGRGLPEQPHIVVDSYDSVDVRLGFSGARWELMLYAQNLLDEYNIVNKSINVDFVRTPGFFGSQRAEAPRRVGLRASYRF